MSSAHVADNLSSPAANILLSSEDQPVIVDFGFANRWSMSAEHSESAFKTSLSWGTPEYLSPERAAQRLHDERLADIWSLGVTMYEVVVGRTPFEKDTTEGE
jgi:serine/threonine protein kinase